MIPRAAVQSSNIRGVGYDQPSQTLAVEFHDGGVYHYAGVSRADHEAFIKAPSPGKFHATFIRPRFTGKRQ